MNPGGPVGSTNSGTGVYTSFVCCESGLFTIPVKTRKAFWPGGGGVEPVGLIDKKRKERKKPREQLEFSGLVFCRLVCL